MRAIEQLCAYVKDSANGIWSGTVAESARTFAIASAKRLGAESASGQPAPRGGFPDDQSIARVRVIVERRHGIAGIRGNVGNVESVTNRF